MGLLVLVGLIILAPVSWLAGGRLWRWLGPIWSFVVGLWIVSSVVSTAHIHIGYGGIAGVVGVLLGFGLAALAYKSRVAGLGILAGAVGYSLAFVALHSMESMVTPQWAVVGLGGAAIATGLALIFPWRTTLAIVLTTWVGVSVILACFFALFPDMALPMWRDGVMSAFVLDGGVLTLGLTLAIIGIAVQVLTCGAYRTQLKELFTEY